MVGVDPTGNGTGDSGGVSSSYSRAGITEGDVEVSQGGQRGEDGPVRRRGKLR